MNKIILTLCALVTVAKADFAKVNPVSFPNTIPARNDEYTRMNRIRYLNIFEEYGRKLERFTKQYSGTEKVINTQTDMLINSIVEIEDHFNPLVILSDLNKRCVRQHLSIPTVLHTKQNITSCVHDFKIQIENLLKKPTDTRNSFHYHYQNYLKTIHNCAQKYGKATAGYNKCVTDATSQTNTYFIETQKVFETDMDVAECSAKAYVKKALDCSYSVKRNTINLIAEANLLTNNCIEGKDECKPCFDCPARVELSANYNLKTMPNLFYNKKDHPGCLLVQLKK